MKVLDLFAGIGGFSLGLERSGMETVAFCEYEEFPQKVLAKHWPDVPCYPDVRELTAEQLTSDGITNIGLICGGYPCQPFSHAGKRQGQADDRHLWPSMFRLICELRPAWVVAENVAGHINMGLDDVLSDLEGQGYTVNAFVIPACAVNAYHRRDRLWIIAHTGLPESQGRNEAATNDDRCSGAGQPEGGITSPPCSDVPNTISTGSRSSRCGDSQEREPKQKSLQPKDREACASDAGSICEDVADSDNEGPQRRVFNGCPDEERRKKPVNGHVAECGAGWEGNGNGEGVSPESSMGRGTNGLPAWLDGFEHCADPDGTGHPRVAAGIKDKTHRLKALGNAVVPQIPEIIGRAIMEVEQSRA